MKYLYSILFVFILSNNLFSQIPGTLDTTFGKPVQQDFTINANSPGEPKVLKIMPDGKLLVGSSGITFNSGRTAGSVAKLNLDDSLDSLYFNSNVITGGQAKAICIQNDGKIVVGGNYSSGLQNNAVFRLNQDGTLDSSFYRGVYQNANNIYALALETSGKILVGGNFYSYQGSNYNYLLRLNTDGTLDTTWTTRCPNDNVTAIVFDSINDRYIIGGVFNSLLSTTAHHIVAIKTSGQIDTSFHGNLTVTINKLLLDRSGKILVASSSGLTRLNSNGTVDPTFVVGTGFNNAVWDIAIDPADRIIAVGKFTSYNGVNQNWVCRLLNNGTMDPTFWSNTSEPFDNSSFIECVALQSNGNIICGGFFYNYGYENRPGLLRLRPDGYLDTTFIPNFGYRINTSSTFYSTIFDIIVQPDYKILVAGDYDHFNSRLQPCLTRLLPNGWRDTSFHAMFTGVRVNDIDVDLQRQQIYAVGNFSAVNGISRTRIVRLNWDGTPDTNFNINFVGYADLNCIKVQPDGKIILSGEISNVGGVVVSNLIRVNTDGTLDPSFNPGTISASSITDIALQSDGKIILCGGFLTISGQNAKRIVRLNSDGTIDNTFNRGNGFDNTVEKVRLDANENIFACGVFQTYKGNSVFNIAKVKSTGDLDTTFRTNLNLNLGASFYDMAIQSNGQVVVGGFFSINPGTVINLIRFNANGRFDSTFYTDARTGVVNSMVIDQNENLLIGGNFTISRDYKIYALARLYINNLTTSIPPLLKKENDLVAYPNPVSDGFYLKVNDGNRLTAYKIIDLQGRIVSSGSFNVDTAADFYFDTQKLTNGLYQLIGSGNGKEVSIRFEVIR